MMSKEDMASLLKYKDILTLILSEFRTQSKMRKKYPIEDLLMIGMRDTISSYKANKAEDTIDNAVKTAVSLLLLAHELHTKKRIS